ncbi:hypothetical protein TKK_0004596 [Trichogramma kaykai]
MSVRHVGSLKFDQDSNTYTWEIFENTKVKEVVLSPSLKINGEKLFRLKLFRTLLHHDICWALNLICLVKLNSSLLTCKYCIKVLRYGQFVNRESNDCTFTPNNNEHHIMHIMHPDRLTSVKFYCSLIIISKNKEKEEKENKEFKKKNLESKLNFEWIFLDKKFSDVVLRTACGKQVPAHRLVLATASPVFQAMFNHDMLENNSRVVNMTDVNHKVAVEMLQYIYTGSVNIQDFFLAAEVLVAAEKYQLEELKNECEQILISHLSTENAIEALKMADTYNAKHLEKGAVDFIKYKMNETLPLSEVKDMLIGKTETDMLKKKSQSTDMKGLNGEAADISNALNFKNFCRLLNLWWNLW